MCPLCQHTDTRPFLTWTPWMPPWQTAVAKAWCHHDTKITTPTTIQCDSSPEARHPLLVKNVNFFFWDQKTGNREQESMAELLDRQN